jgi:hypothetical protein
VGDARDNLLRWKIEQQFLDCSQVSLASPSESEDVRMAKGSGLRQGPRNFDFLN